MDQQDELFLQIDPGGWIRLSQFGDHRFDALARLLQATGVAIGGGQLVPGAQIARIIAHLAFSGFHVLLAGAGLLHVAVVVDRHQTVADLSSRLHDRRFHQFVHRARETHLSPVAPQPHLGRRKPARILLFLGVFSVAGYPSSAISRLCVVARGQAEGVHPLLGHRLPNRLVIPRRDHLVAVQDQYPFTPRGFERRVARRGKILFPGMAEYPGPVLPGDLRGFIRRPGVDHHDLVHQALHALQAAVQKSGLIAGDHAQRKAHPCGGISFPLFTSSLLPPLLTHARSPRWRGPWRAGAASPGCARPPGALPPAGRSARVCRSTGPLLRHPRDGPGRTA